MSEDKISVYVDDYDSCKKYNYLIVEHKNVRIPSREHAIAAAKALIDHYNIKQEELYPWIACTPKSMPVEHQEVLVGWLVDGKIVAYEELVSLADVDYGEDPHTFTLQEWRTRDGELLPDDFDGDPTHWHPIPTL